MRPHLGAVREMGQPLVLGINLGVCHDTAKDDAAISIGKDGAKRCRATLLCGSKGILLPLGILANLVDRVFEKNGTRLVTVLDAPVDAVTVEVAMGIAALTGSKSDAASL